MMKTLDERFVDDPCDDEETIRALVRGDAGGMNINDWVDCRHGFRPSGLSLPNKCSYLHVACYRCRLELVSLQVEAGADVNRRDSDGNTTLHYACVSEDDRLSTIEYLLTINPSLVNEPGYHGRSPLYVACREARLPVVKCLLEHGADLNQCDGDGKAAIHFACEYRKSDVVTHLIENGADINHRDNHGQIPLHEACESSTTDVVKHLVEHGANLLALDDCKKTLYGKFF